MLLDIRKHGGEFRFPVGLAVFGNGRGLLIVLQQIDKKGIHQGIDHLHAVGVVGDVFLENCIKQGFNRGIAACLESEIGRFAFSLQGM